jgi:hypothetical protein
MIAVDFLLSNTICMLLGFSEMDNTVHLLLLLDFLDDRGQNT